MTTRDIPNSAPANGLSRPQRWLLFSAALGGCLLLLLLIPSPLNILLFLLLSAVAAWASSRRRVIAPPAAQTQRSWQRAASLLLTLASFGWMIQAALMFHPTNYYDEALLGFAPALLGFVLLGGALWLKAGPSTEAIPQKTRPAMQAPRWAMLSLGIIALAITLQANISPSMPQGTISHHLQILLFGLGVLLLTGGAGAWRFDPGSLDHLLQNRFNWLLIAILALAALVRLYDLEEGIHRLVDEINFVEAVMNLNSRGNQPILMQHSSITAFTWFYPYTQMLSTNLIGPSLSALRLPSVIFGVIQVGLCYGLVKTLLNRRVALVAALMLACLPPHIHFSRLGLNNIADPTFALLGFWFLARGMRSGRQMDFAVAGAALGMTHYFYEGGRLFYTAFALLWLIWLRLFGQRGQIWRWPSRQQMLVFLGVLGAVIVPVYYTWLINDQPLLPRFNAVGGDVEGFVNLMLDNSARLYYLWQRLQVPLLNILHFPEISRLGGSFYTGETALVLTALVPLLLLGVGRAIWQIRQPAGALLFWWVIGVALANSLMNSARQSPRYVLLFPALAILIALGLLTLWELLLPRASKLARVALILVALGLGAYQSVYYLGTHLPEYYFRQFYDENDLGIPVRDFDDMLFRTVQLPTRSDVHVISPGLRGTNGFGAFLTYYGRGEPEDLLFQAMRTPELRASYLGRLPRARNHAFFIEPDDQATLDLIRLYFELEGPIFSPYRLPRERQFALYFAPLEQNLMGLPPYVEDAPDPEDASE